jgi:hypothetical protein
MNSSNRSIERIPIILGVATVFIALIFFGFEPIELPRVFFSIACTLLVAATAIPKFAVALVKSVIVNNFFTEYHHKTVIGFAIYQIIFAFFSLYVDIHKFKYNSQIDPVHISLYLAIFNPYFILWYMMRINRMLFYPYEWMDKFENNFAQKSYFSKIIDEKSIEQRIIILKKIASQVRDTQEKKVVLSTVKALLNRLLERTVTFNPRNNLQESSTNTQIKILLGLMDATREITTNVELPLEEEHVTNAIHIYVSIWKRTASSPISTDLDHGIIVRYLGELGRSCLERKCPDAAIQCLEALKSIAAESLRCSNVDDYHVHPTITVREMLSIGQAATYSLKMELALGCFTDIMEFVFANISINMENISNEMKINNSENRKYFMFYALQLANDINGKDGDYLQVLKRHINNSEVRAIIGNSQQYNFSGYPIESTKVKRFLENILSRQVAVELPLTNRPLIIIESQPNAVEIPE